MSYCNTRRFSRCFLRVIYKEGQRHTIIKVVENDMNRSLHVQCKERHRILAIVTMNVICLFSESVVWLQPLQPDRT